MSTASGAGAMHCAHCGRPAATLIMIGGAGYHEECTRGPGFQFAPLPVQNFIELMSDERIRRIVREELKAAGLLTPGAAVRGE